jgi:hypothetical protein
MDAGIVFYRRQGDELVGRWSHPSLGGMLADERVGGVEPGTFAGSWPVEISDPSGSPMFAGRLESVPLGQCFELRWDGEMLPARSPAQFVGIGCALDADTLCATFEAARPPAEEES